MRGIDVHIHYPAPPGTETAPWISDAAHHLGGGNAITIDDVAARYEDLDLAGVLLNVDTRSNSGVEPMPNDLIAEAVAKYPGRFAGMGSVDPWGGRAAVREPGAASASWACPD